MIIIYADKYTERRQISNRKYQKLGIFKKTALVPKCRYRHFGTSLSKAFQVIDRFSEDIDITFAEHLGEARRKKLKYNILKPIADELGLMIRNFDFIESDKNLNHYDFYYESVVGDRVINPIPAYVKLETSLMSYAFPTEERELGNYILDALGTEEDEFIATYDLGTFPMRVQSLNRTLIDKVFAVCDYYLLDKPHRNARHLYDIYKLTKHVEMDSDFLELVKEVRAHRITMGSEIAPSAPMDVNIVELVQKICDEDFYKEDYRETTLKLISESLEYEMLKRHYKELVEKIFV